MSDSLFDGDFVIATSVSFITHQNILHNYSRPYSACGIFNSDNKNYYCAQVLFYNKIKKIFKK